MHVFRSVLVLGRPQGGPSHTHTPVFTGCLLLCVCVCVCLLQLSTGSSSGPDPPTLPELLEDFVTLNRLDRLTLSSGRETPGRAVAASTAVILILILIAKFVCFLSLFSVYSDHDRRHKYICGVFGF